jgi:hypothetical protein
MQNSSLAAEKVTSNLGTTPYLIDHNGTEMVKMPICLEFSDPPFVVAQGLAEVLGDAHRLSSCPTGCKHVLNARATKWNVEWKQVTLASVAVWASDKRAQEILCIMATPHLIHSSPTARERPISDQTHRARKVMSQVPIGGVVTTSHLDKIVSR